jgi:DNA-binding Lrp family transcriptional regulator
VFIGGCVFVDLDTKDRALLDILKRDARTPVTVLAEILSLSRNTVQKRIDRLVNTGVIEAFTIRVNEQLQPDKIKALMSVELEGLSTTQLISKLRQVSGVERLHTTNGNWDLLIVIVADSLAHLDDILKSVRAIKGVLNSETSIILSTTQR